MAACKLPFVSKKRRRTLELAEFSWNSNIVIKEELGSGTFGDVYLANFNIAGEPRCVVVETKRCFEKEAGILDSVKGHKNIARFLRFCQESQAIMMEYSCFDFGPLFFDKMIFEFRGQVRVRSCTIRMIIGDNFIEKVQNIFNDQSCFVKINVDVKRDCMTYAFKIIFIQEHVKKLFWSRYKRNEREYNSNNDGRQRTVKVSLK